MTGTASSSPGEETGVLRSGTDEKGEVPKETLDAMVTGTSNQWIEGCGNLGSVPAVIGTTVAGVSIVEMVTSTITRVAVLYARKGPGLWMMAAFWGTAFQIALMPARWALEWGEAQGKTASQAILARIEGANLPADGGGKASVN